MFKFKQQYRLLDINGKRAVWISLLFSGFLPATWFLLQNYALGHTPLSHFLIYSTPIVSGLISLVAAIIILRGKARAGVYTFSITFSAYLAFLTYLLEGAGFMFGIATFVVVTYMISLVQTNKNLPWSPLIGLTVGAVILLMDAYAPWSRVMITSTAAVRAQVSAVVFLVLYLIGLVTQFRDFPLTSKLVMASLALSLIPLGVVAVMTNQSYRMALEENAQSALLSSASQVAVSLDAFILNNLDTIRTEAQMNDIVELLDLKPEERAGSEAEADVVSMLNAFQRKDPINITSYAVFDKNGIIIADTVVEDVNLDKSDRAYFREPMKSGLPYVSQVFYSPVTGVPSVYFSAPIYNGIGEIIGVIRARYSADVLQQLVLNSSSEMTSTSFVILVDDENDIFLANNTNPDYIYRSFAPVDEGSAADLRAKIGLAQDVPAEEIFLDIPTLMNNLPLLDTTPHFVGEFHAVVVDEDHKHAGHQEQAGAARMSTLPWVVVTGEPQEVLFAPIERLARGTLVMGVIAAFAAIFLAMLVSQRIASPLTSLTDAANRFAQGDLNTKASVVTGDEIGDLANSFNSMAAQLRGLIGSLEQRVADRTRALVTSAEVSRRLSTILNQGELVKEVVEQLQSAFNYYHVHIYLYDSARENLVMAGGTGEAGKTMLSKGYSIRAGRGLVGRTAETSVPVLYGDVAKAEGWLPNPLLPETRAELAVPIAIGDQVLGVLDVQQDQVGGLRQEDVDLLQSISNQVAVALQNAQNYARAEQRASREALISAIGQRIQQTSSPEEALKIAVREVGRALGSDYTSVQLNVKPGNGHKTNH